MLQLRERRRRQRCVLPTVQLPGQLQSDGALRLGFDALPPELQLGVDGAVKDEVVLQALGLKGADWRVVTHLLRHPPEAQVLSDGGKNTCRTLQETQPPPPPLVTSPDELVGLSQERVERLPRPLPLRRHG